MPVSPALWEAEIGRIKVPGQHKKTVRENPSQPTYWALWHILV
jgi:hypothetical protein